MKHTKQTSQYWPEGRELPGGYRVVGHLGQGGMGTVYLVERRIALRTQRYAVKTLIPEISENPGRRRNFLRELRTWIDLPDHPNLAGCRFFRTIDDTLAVFAEYIEGHSLDKWIIENSDTSLDSILDIAIQMAWGLQCAHEYGVIHQDIKPSNVLVSHEGAVKITDFGLARHRLTGEESRPQTDSGHTYLISSKGMTMPYCSLEQAMRRKLSRKTDMWSFGLTVLQMFNGGLSWRLGSAAGQMLTTYLAKGPFRPMPGMPDSVVPILRKCFEDDPSDRWNDMSTVASMLIEVYQRKIRRKFPRREPEFKRRDTKETATARRRTVDGGAWLDPDQTYKIALKLVGRGDEYNEDDIPTENQSTQRARALRDIEVYEMAEQIYRDHVAAYKPHLPVTSGYAEMLINKALAVEACKDMTHAARIYGSVRDVVAGFDDYWVREKAARAAMNGSGCWFLAGNSKVALEEATFAVDEYRQLISEQMEIKCLRNMSNSLMNQAVIFDQLGKIYESLDSLLEANNICEELLRMDNSDSNWSMMGYIQINLGLTMLARKKYSKALDAFNQASDIFQMLLETMKQYDVIACLATANTQRAQVLRKNRDLDAAEDLLISTHKFLVEQIEKEKLEDLRADLAQVLVDKAELCLLKGENTTSLKLLVKAEVLMENLVISEDQKHHMDSYRNIRLTHAAIMYAVGDKQKAMKMGVDALVMWMTVATEHQLEREKTIKRIESTLEDLVSDLEYYGRKDVATGIRRLIHTMCKKL